MNRKTRPVTSREYKVMLKAKRFEGDKKAITKAAEGFRVAFADAIEQILVSSDSQSLTGGKLKPVEDEKQVTVRFMDTKALELRKSSLVFRQRQPINGGPIELTLKFRHPDRFLSSDRKIGGKEKFEEDIKVTHTHDFISLHSLSGKFKKVDAASEFKTLADIQQFYEPLEQQLGESYKPNVRIRRVGKLTADQTVLEGPKFKLDADTEAECALILWYRHGGNTKKPLVVEFSFRYKDKKLGSDMEPFTASMARDCFEILQAFRDKQSDLKNWVDLKGPTKTAYVYSLEDM